MKKIILGFGLILTSFLSHAQNGLESIIVEKYYVSNAADAASADADAVAAGYATGALPVGSVTYRIYADLLPGYKVQALYGTQSPLHALQVTTTTSFYNNSAGGNTPTNWGRNSVKNTTGSVLGLDSWFSVGGAASNAYGILKSEDDVTTGGANLITAVSGNVLQNNAAAAGLPLTTQDGYFYSGAPSGLAAPQTVTFVGLTTELNPFTDGSTVGNSFFTTNGSIASLNGSVGPVAATNKVLLGQFTTDGVFSFHLNLQIGTPTGGSQNYVASNPTGAEISIPSLNLVPNIPPTVSITAPLTGTNFITGSNVSIAANASDVDGTVSSVKFLVDGVVVGTDLTAAYTAAYTAAIGTHTLIAKAFDNSGDSTSSAPVTITVANNQAPTITVTAPSTGVVGDVIALTGNAADVDGTVASVEFFVDGVSLSIDNSSPFQASWTATLGLHHFTARATDNLGLQTTSVNADITVAANIPPAVGLTSPLSTATYTAPAVVTVSANASDADGTVSQVEFFVNGVSIGVDATSPYSVNWTSAIGNAVFTAVATDNRGATTTSAAITLSIADPNALPYKVVGITERCTSHNFCLPVAAFASVSNVIGYDMVLHYNPAKVRPTGNITVANALITPSYVDVANSIDSVSGIINISAFLNATAPASTYFTGTGNLLCVEFNKTAGFANVDTAHFTVSPLQESYFSGVVNKLVTAGDYISYRDSLFTGALNFWADSSAILYNVGNPNQYLVTNIYGTSATGTNQSVTAVQPNLTGNFTYVITHGTDISIQRDILSNTSVQPVVNGFDAFLARKLLINDPTFIPSAYQMVAMDVNLDGVISAGDVSQINQRTVLVIPEYRQAWNYNNQGISNGQLSKDWLFVDSLSLASPAYHISTTFPADNGTGFSKYRVPVVPFHLPVPLTGYSTCPDIRNGAKFTGVMLGDVNGSYRNIAADGVLKHYTTTDKVVFDLNNAVMNNGSIEIPVSIVSNNVINSLDFAMQFNQSNLTYNSIVNHAFYTQALDNFNTADNTLRFTSNSLQNYDITQPIVSVRFATSASQITDADLSSMEGYLNGEKVNVEVLGSASAATGVAAVNSDNYMVNIYPNPAKETINIIASQNATVQLMDVEGKQVIYQTVVTGGQKQEIDTQAIANGVYIMKVANDKFVSIKKVVINK